DLFALGVIACELFSGKNPFRKETTAETLAAILNDPTPSLPQITPELARVIHRCLEKKTENRFASAQELVFALKMVPIGNIPRTRKSSKKVIRSIAVLPFENVSGDPELEYLGDGIVEGIIHILSQIAKLKVMARSTVFHYRGSGMDPQVIGRYLNVGAVLSGRILQHGDMVTIRTELLDVNNGWHVWGDQFHRKVADIIAVQSEIVNEISSGLKLHLSGSQKKMLTKQFTQDPEAYKMYLKGRYYWNRRTEEGMKRAIDYFQKAIDIDPVYALAYSGLSDSYALSADFGFGSLTSKEAFGRARFAVMKALELDDSLAEAHASLGHLLEHEFHWEEAEKEYKRSLKLNPGYATTHHWYFMALAMMGRNQESLAEMSLAQSLDPLSLIIQTDVGSCHYSWGDYDKALEILHKVVEMDFTFTTAHRYLIAVYEQKGMYKEAIEESEKAFLATSKDTSRLLTRSRELQQILEVEGPRGYWKKRLEHNLQSSKPYRLAQIYGMLGDKESALTHLEKAIDEMSALVIYSNVDPRLKSLRSDPRFAAILKRIGFVSS
ncbi:MAG: hypothetical protein C5B54_08630, partial [Acidobacteria bacterium]